MDFVAKIKVDSSDFIRASNEAAAAGAKIEKSIGGGLKINTSSFDGLIAKFKEGQKTASEGGGMFGTLASKLGELASPAGLATAAIGGLAAGFAASIAIGKEFEQSLAGVGAVTGLSGNALSDIGQRAKDLAAQFGGDANTQLKAFQGTLSKFGADLAKSPEDLGKVATSINLLSKAGGIDAQQSMDALANSMLQFGVNVSNSKEAARESERFINVLAASARVGAAEIPQVADAILVAGVAAKGAKVSLEETNAAIQVLAAGGKVGAEAGTALRNVLGKLAGEDVIPKDAATKLKALGVDMAKVSDTSKPLSERLKELGKASSDATVFAQIFGTENAAAASILVSGTDTIQKWTKEITGTKDAQEQAAKNMATFGEAMSRLKATLSNVAITIFQYISPALTLVANALSNLFSSGSESGGLIGSFKNIFNAIQPLAEFLLNGLIAPFRVAFELLRASFVVLQDVVGSVFAALSSALSPLKSAFSGLFSEAGSGVDIFGILRTVFESLASVAGGVLKVSLGAVVGIIGGIVKVVATLIEWTTTAIKWIKDIAVRAYEWVTSFGVVRAAIQVVSTVVSAFIDKVVGAYNAVVKFLGIGQTIDIKVESKTDVSETVAGIEQVTQAEAKKQTAKVEKEGETAFQKAQKRYQDEVKAINAVTDALKEKLEKQAADAGRDKLNAEERLELARAEVKAAEEIAAKASAFTKVRLVASKNESKADVDKIIQDANLSIQDKRLKVNAELLIGAGSFSATSKQLADSFKDVKDSIKVDNLFSQDALNAAKIRIAELGAELAVVGSKVSTPEMSAEFEKLKAEYKGLQDELTENTTKAALERREVEITVMAEGSEKEIAIKRLALDKKYSADIAAAQKFGLDTKNITAKYLSDISSLTATSASDIESVLGDIFKDFGSTLEQAFKDADNARKDAIAKADDSKKELKKEEDDLEKSLASRLLSYEEYTEKRADIDAKRIKSEIKEETSADKAINALNKSTLKVFLDLSAKQLDDYKKHVEATKGQGETLGSTLSTLGEIALSQFAAIAVSGGNVWKEMAKAIFNMARSAAASLSVVILGKELAEKSFLGISTGAVLTALIQTALAAAQAATVGFKTGRRPSTGENTSAVMGMVHGGEDVFRADISSANRGLFDYLHKGGRAENYFRINNSNADIVKELAAIKKHVSRGTYKNVNVSVSAEKGFIAKNARYSTMRQLARA